MIRTPPWIGRPDLGPGEMNPGQYKPEVKSEQSGSELKSEDSGRAWWKRELPFKTEEPKGPEAGAEKMIDGAKEITTINQHYEGQEHPETGVPYERTKVTLPDGTVVEGVFPKFEPAAEVTLDENAEGNYEGHRNKHEKQANAKLKEMVENDPELRQKFTPEQLEQINNGDTPDGYTWHHHQEPGRMQLVDSETHAQTGHTGGYALWGQKEEGNHA